MRGRERMPMEMGGGERDFGGGGLGLSARSSTTPQVRNGAEVDSTGSRKKKRGKILWEKKGNNFLLVFYISVFLFKTRNCTGFVY